MFGSWCHYDYAAIKYDLQASADTVLPGVIEIKNCCAFGTEKYMQLKYSITGRFYCS